MKTKLVLTGVLISFLFLTGCSNNEGNVQESESVSKSSSLSKSSSVTNTFPQAQAEVLETFKAIAESITLGAGNGYNGEYMDQLISFHAYGDKFIEFNNGNLYNSAENEANERTFFGTIVAPGGVKQFAPIDGTLKIAVYYGNVANLTFISDFILNNDPNLNPVNDYTVNNLINVSSM